MHTIQPKILRLQHKSCEKSDKENRVMQGKRGNFEETVHWYGDEKLTEV